jgi:hypothetical protein
MALGAGIIELVGQLRSEGYLRDRLSVAEIGSQQLGPGFLDARDAMARVGKLFDVTVSCPLTQSNASHALGRDGDAPYARDFWAWLGFDYLTVDIDGIADVSLDLNCESVAPELVGNYQLVTNFGTTEHIANQLNAFKVIHDLAAPGGLMIHDVPLQGMLNHGLINYNPKFFWMLARSNSYRTIHMSMSADRIGRALPQNIAEAIAPFDPSIVARGNSFSFVDTSLIVILQKVVNAPYAAPIDLADAMSADHALAGRYPSVFERDKFIRLAQFDDVLDAIPAWRLRQELLLRCRRRLARWFN